MKTVPKTCFICHKSSKQIFSAPSTDPITAETSGIVELDGRPKELTAEILKNQLEVCPHCGYIAEDIGEKTGTTKDFLQSPDFFDLQNPDSPPLASRYIRAARIQLEEKNPKKALDYYLMAAWSADTMRQREIAVSCRRKALSLIFAGNKTFADIPSDKWVPVIDTMRRCGDFDSVITHCTNLLAIAGPTLRQGLDYELFCAKQHDDEPHTNLDAANSNQCRSGAQEVNDEFIIGGKSYSGEDDCYGNGWNWVAETRTLFLSNYHGSSIEASGDLTIRVEQMDNQILSPHGPGILIHNGTLKLIGLATLTIKGDDAGILVESGSLEIAKTVLIIRTSEYGIFSAGNIIITNGSVLDISSETTAIRSAFGGLTINGMCSLTIYGNRAGIDLAGDMNFSVGGLKIESPEGCGILIHHGSIDISSAIFDAFCGDTGILLEEGSLTVDVSTFDLNAASCVQVNGSCNILRSNGTLSGENYGCFVSQNMDLSGDYEISGKIAIAVGGNLQIQNGNITASGETGISVGVDLNYIGGGLMLTGDTAMQIAGNAEISGGQIMGIGKINGIVVNGSYTMSGGDISVSGEAEDGMRISGEKMTLTFGSITVSGRTHGLVVAGSAVIESIRLSASGNIGFSVGKSLKIERGRLKISGVEIGLSVKEGDLILGTVVNLNANGNVGIYTTKDIVSHGATVIVSGRFGGIVSEKGNLIITNGRVEITADEYGMLIPSGSTKIPCGIIRITNSRMRDSGGCGIVVEKGDLELGGLITIDAENYAISVPCGEISVLAGNVEAYGFRAGITGKSLTIKEASLTAYGKTEGAVVLTEQGPWRDAGIVVQAGKSGKTATDGVYSGQRFLHAYTERVPDAS
ncbi:MAG: hypothetical protein KBA49_02025 [Methanolinea sp.]|jgi:hypothetical protein|nr:hypothetical protein [Methanolinea sp.]